MKSFALMVLALLGGLLLAILATTSPSADPADAPLETFSAERAMKDVRIIAAKPHPTGSPENAIARKYIIDRLTEIGLEVTTTQGEVPERSLERFGRWSGEAPDALMLTNIIGVLPGSEPDLPAVLLMAHHDTVYGSPGAADDTAGVAAIIESVRAIAATGQLRRNVIVLMTDGEELALLGARKFFATNPMRENVGAIINLEARGGGGRATLFQTSRDNGAAIGLYANSVSKPAGTSLSAFVYETLPNDTDLTPALKGDFTAYNLAFIGRPGLYHSPLATPARLDIGSVQDMGDQTLELTRALGMAGDLGTRAPSVTFFDVFGLFMIHYSQGIGWLLFALAAGLHIYGATKSDARATLVRAELGGLAVLIVGAAALFALNIVSGAGSGEGNYYDRLAAIPMLEVQAALAIAGVLALTAGLWRGYAVSLVAVLLAFSMQLLAPLTSYLLVIPLLVWGAAQVIAPRIGSLGANILRVVAAAFVLGFLLHAGHQVMQGVGPDLPSAAALLALLALPVLGALMPEVHRRKLLTASAVFLLAATAVALWVRFDAVAETVPVYDSMKG